MAPSRLDHIAIMVIAKPISVISKQRQENAMHPNPVAPRRRASPADFPALSRGSAAPTFVEMWTPKDRQRVSGTVMQHAPRVGARQLLVDKVRNRVGSAALISGKCLMAVPFTRIADRSADPSVARATVTSSGPRRFIEAIAQLAAAGLIAAAVAGSRFGPMGALVCAFAFGAAWIWNRTQRQNPNKNGA
jgi:hypothetical protein